MNFFLIERKMQSKTYKKNYQSPICFKYSAVLLYLLLCSISPISSNDFDCRKFGSPGFTFPKGEINLEVGQVLELFCILNLSHSDSEGLNSSNLDFSVSVKNPAGSQRSNVGGHWDVDRSNVHVLNETTAVLRLGGLDASTYLIDCLIPDEEGHKAAVCSNQVNIGYTPQNVSDFKCLAKDWKEMKCTWKPPDNPINTSYSLSFVKSNLERPCPLNTSTPTSCEWGPRTEPHYHQNFRTYDLRLKGTNAIKPDGEEFKFLIDHFSIVVPQPPDIVEKRAFEDGVIMINWTFPLMADFIPGLNHRISVCLASNNSKTNNKTNNCEITNLVSKKVESLKHNFKVNNAFQNYSVSVQMKSSTAKDLDEFWSMPKSVQILSLPKKPDSPPKIDMGGFEIHRQFIQIYWKEVPALLYNGPNFTYEFNVLKDREQIDVEVKEVSSFSAKFPDLKEAASVYQIEIRSKNSEGRSSESSKLRIVRNVNAADLPQKVSKYDYSNGSFEISWKAPVSGADQIESYSVFKCTGIKNCTKNFDWDTVKGSGVNRKFYQNLPNFKETRYHFAVSANKRDSSSGLVWASCSLDEKLPEKLRLKPEPFKSEKEIRVEWTSGCSYQKGGSVEGFKIYYCQVQNSNKLKCIGEEKSIFISDLESLDYDLQDLSPFSSYKIQISVLSQSGESRSDPLIIKTDETAPSHEPEIFLNQVLNTSVSIEIVPPGPESINGELRHYQVLITNSDNPSDVRNFTIDKPNEKVHMIDGLNSNTYYIVKVSACTIKCSEFSHPLNIKTKFGKTYMSKPKFQSTGGGKDLEIIWDTPRILGGPVEEFNLKITRDGDTLDIVSVPYDNGKKEYSYHKEIMCDTNTNFTARVRAITLGSDDTLITGDWSNEGEFICQNNAKVGKFNWVLATVGIVVGVLILIFLVITALKCWMKLRRMKEVDIVLPIGLRNTYNSDETKRIRKNSGGETSEMKSSNLFYLSSVGDTEIRARTGSEMDNFGNNNPQSSTTTTTKGFVRDNQFEKNDQKVTNLSSESRLNEQNPHNDDDHLFWQNPFGLATSARSPKIEQEKFLKQEETSLIDIPSSRINGNNNQNHELDNYDDVGLLVGPTPIKINFLKESHQQQQNRLKGSFLEPAGKLEVQPPKDSNHFDKSIFSSNSANNHNNVNVNVNVNSNGKNPPYVTLSELPKLRQNSVSGSGLNGPKSSYCEFGVLQQSTNKLPT